MGRLATLLLIAGGIAGLWGFRQLRREPKASIGIEKTEVTSTESSATVPTAESSDAITMTLEKARRGDLPARVQWLDANEMVLGQQQAVGSQTPLDRIPGTQMLRVSAPGHRTLTVPWPETSHLHVALAAAGDDQDLYVKAPEDLSTTGPVECALRLIDSRTNRFVPDVEVRLDGETLGTSGTVGAFSIPFLRLQQGQLLELRHPSYLPLSIDLNPGRIDVLQVIPLRLEPR